MDPPIHNVGGASLKLREHHRCATEHRTRSRGNAFESECDREVKNGNAFHRAPASDLVVAPFEAAGPRAKSLSKVLRLRILIEIVDQSKLLDLSIP